MITVTERGSTVGGAHYYSKMLGCPLGIEEEASSLLVGTLTHAALEHYYNGQSNKKLAKEKFSGYSGHVADEALRLARAYLKVAPDWPVVGTEVKMSANLDDITIGGRFDLVVDIGVEQAIMWSDIGCPLSPGMWVVDYKTHAGDRFNADSYWYAPQGYFYDVIGQENGLEGIIFAGISKEHPAHVTFESRLFGRSCRPMVISFISYCMNQPKGLNLTKCFQYGRYCGRLKECLNV